MDLTPREQALSQKFRHELDVVERLMARLRRVLAQSAVAGEVTAAAAPNAAVAREAAATPEAAVTPEMILLLNQLADHAATVVACEAHSSDLTETALAADCPQLIAELERIQAGRETLCQTIAALADRATDSPGEGGLKLEAAACARELQEIQSTYFALERREAEVDSHAVYDENGGEN